MNIKKLMIGAMVVATLSACEKEELYMRNYAYPGNANNPLESLRGGNILVELGESDNSIMKRIRAFTYKNFADTVEFPYIFLSPVVYGSNISEDISICNLNPKYLLFPHSFGFYICLNGETKDVKEYSDELKELIKYQGKKQGKQAFCDKYFNSELTLGMKLE